MIDVAAAFLFALAGMAALHVGSERIQRRTIPGRQRPVLRMIGFGCLGLTLWLAIKAQGAAIGITFAMVIIAVVGIVLNFALAYVPNQSRSIGSYISLVLAHVWIRRKE